MASSCGIPTVLVTGATGFVGSWLVRLLLQKGYRVRATVLDPGDKQDLYPLSHAISPSLIQQLEIVKADLLVEGDFDAAVQGCEGVFHLAYCAILNAEDPQKEVIDPSVQGTLNVLKACTKSPSVRRVIHVSSVVAIWTPGKQKADQVFDESCWTDVEFCLKTKHRGWTYYVAKTLGERAALEFAKKHNLDVVVMNPTLIAGPFLLPTIPKSVRETLTLVTGHKPSMPTLLGIPYVHIDDAVSALIFLYENREASGRYICSAVNASTQDLMDIIQSNHLEFQSPTDLSHLGELEIHYFDSSKLKALGFEYKHTTLKDIFNDAIKCCKEKGLL